MSAGRSRSNESSSPVFQTFPGATGDASYGTSGDVFKQTRGLTTSGVQSPFAKSLEDTLLNPQFGARTSSEQALIDSLMDVTSARGAVSGFGAPTQSALATSIAPTMVDMRNKNIEQLLGAKGQDVQAWQSQLQSLLELVGLSMPQIMGGQQSSEEQKSRGISFCWVAREVYGAMDPRWILFRNWMFAESPMWFFMIYGNYGERISRFISNKPIIKKFVKKWMDSKIGRT